MLYARRHVDYRDPNIDNIYDVELDLRSSTGNHADGSLAMCPVEDIEKCELHIGGKDMYVLGDCDKRDTLTSVGDDEMLLSYQFGPMDDHGWPAATVEVEFGPSPDPQADDTLSPAEYRDAGITHVRFTSASVRRDPFITE